MEDNGKKLWLQSQPAKLVLAIIMAFILGYFVSSLTHKPSSGSEDSPASKQAVSQKWYCSMDPQIIRNGPGDCPICGMDLIPMPGDAAIGVGEGYHVR